MFTIALEKKKTFNLKNEGGTCIVTVTYKVPTALDVDTFGKDIKDSDIFKKFVINIESDLEQLNGIMPSNFCALPLYYVVSQTARDILRSAYFIEEEKN